MPLVRIDMRKGRPDGFAGKVGEIVYRAMTETMNVPAKDNFQVITQHAPDGLVYDPEYLDVPRSDGIVFIQITLNAGRTVQVKQAFYKRLAEQLHAELGIRVEDVLVSLVEVTKDNWSFGNGVAQYVQ
jgi:4-oxalocrotonate tautomerase